MARNVDLLAQVERMRKNLVSLQDECCAWSKFAFDLAAERDEARAWARRLYAERAKGVK